MLICFSTHCTKPNKSKNHTGIHLLFDFAENQIVFWDFKIRSSIWITEGLDNGDG